MRGRVPRPLLALIGAVAVAVGTFGASAHAEPLAADPASDITTLASSAGCGSAPTISSGTHSIQVGGTNRSFILRVPDGYDSSRAYPLIFGFHWNGGTAGDVSGGGTDGANWSYYGLQRLSNNSAIFVAPQGVNNGWANSGGQDVAFVDAMIARLESGLCVDTAQRFALGFSYGGGMSYSLACSRPTVFRAVAVYAGGQLSGCSGGTQPVAYLGIHGISDNVLNISAGRSLRDRFVANNGCTPQNAPEPASGSRTHIVTSYSGCRAGYPVQWAAFDGGHTPGPIDGTYEDGWQTWTSGVTWNFFSQFGSGDPGGGGDGEIVGAQSSRCLDVSGQSQTNGADVQLWDCNGASNQEWTRTSAGELRVYGGKCLDAEGAATAPGTRAIIWDCHGGANQKWNVNADGTITNAQSGLCLDATENRTANGTKVVLWTCNGGANQRWTLG
ncbi:lectin [Glycomyces sp. YM15]|uniref:lectin n=1 Tax=Glycomyces sp. YM15 TaxID=2800446 RepID=UPI0035ABF13D